MHSTYLVLWEWFVELAVHFYANFMLVLIFSLPHWSYFIFTLCLWTTCTVSNTRGSIEIELKLIQNHSFWNTGTYSQTPGRCFQASRPSKANSFVVRTHTLLWRSLKWTLSSRMPKKSNLHQKHGYFLLTAVTWAGAGCLPSLPRSSFSCFPKPKKDGD